MVTPVISVFRKVVVGVVVVVVFMQMLAHCEQGEHSSLSAHCPHAKSQSRVQPHVLSGPDGLGPFGR